MREEMASLWNAMKVSHYKRTIDQLTKSITDSMSLEDSLKVALDTVMNAVHAETGSFWFYERFRDGRIYPKAVCEGSNLDGISLLPGEGIAGQVIETGKPIIIQDCQADPRWAGRVDKKTGFKTMTMICVPLTLENLVFGCIQIINKTDSIAFDEKDLSFAERLASEIELLLKHRGFLEDYAKAAVSDGLMTISKAPRDEVSFREVLCAESEREMEYLLRSFSEFSALRLNEQKEAMRLARELRNYLIKSNSADADGFK